MVALTPMLLTALTAGATSIATGSLQEIGREAYVGLKARVLARFKGKADVETAIEMLEAEPKSAARQTLLKEELNKGVAAKPEAAGDDELRAAAQALIDLLNKNKLPTVTAVKISIVGDGAIAHGKGAVAAGKRGVAIGGNVDNSTIITGDKNNTSGEK